MVDAVFMLFLFSLPSVAYANIHARREGSWGRGLAQVGIRPSRRRNYLEALGVLIVLSVLGAVAVALIPMETVTDPRVVPGRGQPLAAMLSALAEEMLFRGFGLALLIPRFGFQAGNAIQVLLFALPRAFLLTIAPVLWQLVLVQLAMAWLLGWLRHRSGSILPGFVIHVMLNLALLATYGA